MDRAGAREELWRRYDDGDLSASALERRLRRLDEAGSEADVQRAIDDRLPMRATLPVSPAAAVAMATGSFVVLVVVAALVVGSGSPTGDTEAPRFEAGPAPIDVDGIDVAAPPEPPIDVAECPAPEDQLVAEHRGETNPALLSEPAVVPTDYELDDEDDITPGADPDPNMSVAAGTPLPLEVLGRELDGHLPVLLRAFRYSSHEDAAAAGRSSTRTACNNAVEFFQVPGHEGEIGGAVITRVIPTTVFVSWLLDDRRFVVSVETDGDDAEDIEQAKALAGEIAAAELDAARTPPPLR